MSGNDLPFGIKGNGAIDRRRFLATAGMLGASLWGFGPALAQDETFKLGWVRASTGPFASSFGFAYIAGLIAIDEINAAGGIMGRPIERVEIDDEGAPGKEAAIIRKLKEDGVNYVCGPVGSSQALASLSSGSRVGMIQTSYANAAELGDAARNPYHYQCLANTEQQGQVAVAYLTEILKAKKIGILQENTAFGDAATSACTAALKKRKLYPKDIQIYPLSAPNLNSYVGNLKRSGVDGVLAWIATVPQLTMAFQAMVALDWFPPMTGNNVLFLGAVVENLPDKALQNAYGVQYRTLTYTKTEDPGELQQQFSAKLSKVPDLKGFEPVVAASPFYDFIHLLKQVIETEKSFDPMRVKRALDAVSGYQGLLGTLSFTPTNHTGVPLDGITVATLASARAPQSQGCFRERAPGT